MLVTAADHPTLAWFKKSSQSSRVVPPGTRARLAAITNLEEAFLFLEAAGFHVNRSITRSVPDAVSVSLFPPEGLSAHPAIVDPNYYGPQMVLPITNTTEVPVGTVLVNCLLPPIEDQAAAEIVFEGFQNIMLAFTTALQALPFACLTGHKVANPKHPLDQRGFRFFFSPEPQKLLERISLLLTLTEQFEATPGDDRAQRRATISQIQGLKFGATADGRRVPLSIMEDVKGYPGETTLVVFSPFTA